ncbi:hypothetical protein [Leptospira gomenensis]|uniref:hypothetical protein n=1 Tax=Leptospira gomenensis TaxID=2484974 RepID=UPI001FEEFA6A|nr:hypothetical protein [Leptospira gomenensis]
MKITSSLTWSEQNGFNGSASYNFLSKEQMAKEAAKGAQKNQGNLFLNIMDGLGYNLGGREGEPTLWDNIKGAFSDAWNTVKGAGNWIGNKAAGAFNSVSNFVSNTYNKLFGPKVYPMLLVGGDAGSGGGYGSSEGVLSRGGHENINNFEFDETKFYYEVVDANGKTVPLEEYRAGLEKKVRDKLTSDPNYKGDLEKDTKRILQEASQIFMKGHETEWKNYNDKTGTEESFILGGIVTDSIEVDASGNAHYVKPTDYNSGGFLPVPLIRRSNSFYFMDTQAVKPGGNGLFPLYQMKFDGTQNQWLGRLVGTVGNQILYPQDGSPVDQVIYPSKPVWANPGTDGFNHAGNNPWVPMKPPQDNRPF